MSIANELKAVNKQIEAFHKPHIICERCNSHYHPEQQALLAQRRALLRQAGRGGGEE